MHQLLLRFCVLGSAVGGGAFVVARDLLGATQSAEMGKTILAFVLGVPFWGVLSSFMSIPVGLVPAAGAGLAYWFILSRYTVRNPSAFIRMAVGAAVGGAAAVAFGGTLFATGTSPGGYAAAVNTWSWLIAGLIGGSASALSARKATYEAIFAARNVTNEA